MLHEEQRKRKRRRSEAQRPRAKPRQKATQKPGERRKTLWWIAEESTNTENGTIPKIPPLRTYPHRTRIVRRPDYGLKGDQNEARDTDLFRAPRDAAFPAGKLNTEGYPIASPVEYTRGMTFSFSYDHSARLQPVRKGPSPRRRDTYHEPRTLHSSERLGTPLPQPASTTRDTR